MRTVFQARGALVREDHAPGESMPRFAAVELKLDAIAQGSVVGVAKDVGALDDATRH